MLTGKQKRHLRSLAHHLNPVVQVGKSGITAGVIEQVDLALEAHELVKISILDTSPVGRDELAELITEEIGADWVQSLGRTVVLYRPSTENPRIELP